MVWVQRLNLFLRGKNCEKSNKRRDNSPFWRLTPVIYMLKNRKGLLYQNPDDVERTFAKFQQKSHHKINNRQKIHTDWRGGERLHLKRLR